MMVRAVRSDDAGSRCVEFSGKLFIYPCGCSSQLGLPAFRPVTTAA